MIKFEPRANCNYKYDYAEVFKQIAEGKISREGTYKSLILNDLFFVLCFVMERVDANHPFIVDYCRDIEKGVQNYRLELVARGHYKTSIMVAEVLQRIVKNPESRTGIFSHVRPMAKKPLRLIKNTLESSELLKACFPDVLWEDPTREAPKWSEDEGIIVKRKGKYSDATVEAWPLIDGMPTGSHFTHLEFDDIETQDLVGNPDTIKRLINAFDLAMNLTDKGFIHRVRGTPYHHAGVLQYIRKMTKFGTQKPRYELIKKPATKDGTVNGEPVFLSQEDLDDLKRNEYGFNCMQLLNPTPDNSLVRLNSEYLKFVHPEAIPSNVYKFMVIDPAGDSKDGKGDRWAIHLIGVEPKADDIGASNLYLLDSIISTMGHSEAIETITRMYLRGGLIMQVGVEKVALSTVEIHVANALRARGRHISIEDKSLVLLKPGGRKKETRIAETLTWPLNNGKLHISLGINKQYIDILRAEMDGFPFGKYDDGIDGLGYAYDLLKEYKFSNRKRTGWDRADTEYNIFERVA